jgi:hypothetical protein
VEVIVALAIFSTTILAVFAALRTCAGAAHHARMLTKAVLLAETLLAETTLSEDRSFGVREGQEGLYRWRVRTAPTPVENLATIRAEVIWQERHVMRQYELVSFLHLRPGS